MATVLTLTPSDPKPPDPKMLQPSVLGRSPQNTARTFSYRQAVPLVIGCNLPVQERGPTAKPSYIHPKVDGTLYGCATLPEV